MAANEPDAVETALRYADALGVEMEKMSEVVFRGISIKLESPKLDQFKAWGNDFVIGTEFLLIACSGN